MAEQVWNATIEGEPSARALAEAHQFLLWLIAGHQEKDLESKVESA